MKVNYHSSMLECFDIFSVFCILKEKPKKKENRKEISEDGTAITMKAVVAPTEPMVKNVQKKETPITAINMDNANPHLLINLRTIARETREQTSTNPSIRGWTVNNKLYPDKKTVTKAPNNILAKIINPSLNKGFSKSIPMRNICIIKYK